VSDQSLLQTSCISRVPLCDRSSRWLLNNDASVPGVIRFVTCELDFHFIFIIPSTQLQNFHGTVGATVDGPVVKVKDMLYFPRFCLTSLL